jgi:hypothetical protein
MNLQYSLPCGVRIGTIEVGLETSTLFWLDLIEDMEGGATLQRLERAILYIRKNGRELNLNELSANEVRAVYDKILWFMSGGKEQKPTSGRSLSSKQEKLLSYKQDFDYIYSAFMQVYGIDLFKFIRVDNGRNVYEITDMHLWKFLALMTGLPKGNILTDYIIYYRGMDLSKLPTKTKADIDYKREVADIKAKLALESNTKVKRVKGRTAFDRIVRKLDKERGQWQK